MITARLQIPRPDGLIEEVVLELPEGSKIDGFDLLDRFIARFGPGRKGVPETGSTPSQAGTGRTVAAAPPLHLPPAPERPAASLATKVPAVVRDTSRAAYDDLVASGKMSRQHRALVAFLKARPGRDWTRAELAEGIGWRINVICGRVNELLTPPFDALEEVGRRACLITGESANALRLVVPNQK